MSLLASFLNKNIYILKKNLALLLKFDKLSIRYGLIH